MCSIRAVLCSCPMPIPMKFSSAPNRWQWLRHASPRAPCQQGFSGPSTRVPRIFAALSFCAPAGGWVHAKYFAKVFDFGMRSRHSRKLKKMKVEFCPIPPQQILRESLHCKWGLRDNRVLLTECMALLIPCRALLTAQFWFQSLALWLLPWINIPFWVGPWRKQASRVYSTHTRMGWIEINVPWLYNWMFANWYSELNLY